MNVGYTHISSAFFTYRFVDHESSNFCCWRVHGTEAKHIQKNEAAVVDKVLNCLPSKRGVGICQLGDVRDRVDTVDMWEDTSESQVRG